MLIIAHLGLSGSFAGIEPAQLPAILPHLASLKVGIAAVLFSFAVSLARRLALRLHNCWEASVWDGRGGVDGLGKQRG